MVSVYNGISLSHKKDTICCLKETHFIFMDTHRLKSEGMEKIFQANGNQKKAGVAILIADKIDFKLKMV